MALWPFNRRKRKGTRAEDRDDDQNLGISTMITGPEDSKQRRTQGRREKSASKSHSRQVSTTRDPDLASPLSAHPPMQRNMASASSFEKVSPSPDARSPAPRLPLAEVPNRAHPTASPAFKASIRGDSKISLPPARSATEPGTPTLNHKRSRGPNEASRQKSSKRRAEEKDRLRELREMSSPIPVPRPPRRASTQATGTTTHGGSTRNLQRPMSEVSLPLAESIRSSFSGTLEQLSSSYRISAFDALSPRPTIRYSDHPQRLSEGGTPSRSITRKEKSPAIMEEEGDFGPRARIKDLADDLDARALRQVMEREQRRKERKAKTKLEKVERDRRRQDATSKRHATPSTAQDQPNDVQMRDAEEAGPSTAPGTAREASPSPLPKQRRSPPPEPTQSPSSWLQDPSEESLKRDAPSPMDTNGNDDKEEPVLETAQAVRLSSANIVPPSPNEAKSTTEHTDTPSAGGSKPPPPPPKSIARELAQDSITDKPTENLRDSESGGASRIMAIFRRGGTKHRGSSDKSRGTPSEFSNTSRESFVRQQKAAAASAASASPAAGPPGAVPTAPRSFTPQKTLVTSTTPLRTKSKFREDLPDFPVSPPSSRNSRIIRPDSPISPASPASPYIDDHSKVEAMNDEARATTPIGDVHPALRGDMNRSLGQSPRSISPEAAALSQSLASVDSEGSWLSGRPQKRSSIPVTTLREGGGSISEHVGETGAEPPAEKDPSYFARREPADRPTLQASGLTSQLARGLQTPSGLGEIPVKQLSPTDGELKEGRITGHRPMVVQSGGSHRSREGLVMETAADDASPRSQKAEIEGGSADSQRPSPDRQDFGPEVGEVFVQQATSVDLNRGPSHSRRVSAGSARILDIPPRVPGEKRNSTLSFGSSVPSPGIPQRTFEDAEADEGSDAAKNLQGAVGVRSSLGPGQTAGLGLGLRIGSRNASGAADEKEAQATSGDVPRRTSVDE